VYCSAIVAATSIPANNAFAISADDVSNKMSKDERFGYVTGMLDMLTYQASIGGNKPKADCIVEAYYGDGKDAAWEKLLAAFEALPEKYPASIVTVLVNKACGE